MRVAYSYLTATAVALASACVQGATFEKDQREGQMVPELNNIGGKPVPSLVGHQRLHSC
jgi:hypothetical protein